MESGEASRVENRCRPAFGLVTKKNPNSTDISRRFIVNLFSYDHYHLVRQHFRRDISGKMASKLCVDYAAVSRESASFRRDLKKKNIITIIIVKR